MFQKKWPFSLFWVSSIEIGPDRIEKKERNGRGIAARKKNPFLNEEGVLSRREEGKWFAKVSAVSGPLYQ